MVKIKFCFYTKGGRLYISSYVILFLKCNLIKMQTVFNKPDGPYDVQRELGFL